jgi:predicted DNA-binding protein (MmcQ/YjbR family)
VKDVFGRPVFARVRRLCLAFPETAETSSWGHPNFRAGRKTFCALEIVGGRPSIAFRLPPADVDLLLPRDRFFATPYGRGQWASLWIDGAVDWRLVERLLQRSYRQVANQRMIGLLDAKRHSSMTRGQQRS